MRKLGRFELQQCDIQGRLFELAFRSGYDSEPFIRGFMNGRAATSLDDTYDRPARFRSILTDRRCRRLSLQAL